MNSGLSWWKVLSSSMKTYNVRFTRGLYDKIEEIAKFISSLVDEILTLSYRADTMPKLIWDSSDVQHSDSRRMLVKKGRLSVFFIIYKNYVIVYDIVPSKLLTKELPEMESI
jgi:hypothetical protein